MTQVDMLYYRMAMGEITQEEVNAGLDRLRGNDYRREYRKKLQHLNLTQDYNVTLSKGVGRSTFFSRRAIRNSDSTTGTTKPVTFHFI